MKHPLSRCSVIMAIVARLVPMAVAVDGQRIVPVQLRLDPAVTLAVVAQQMNVVLAPDIPVPEILFESTTPLQRFQNAIAGQWGFAPEAFANAYVSATNEIYLVDDAAYYGRRKTTIDDSLAHEFVHYLQVRYLNADLSDPSLEVDALAVQERFRSDYALSYFAPGTSSAGTLLPANSED